MSLARSTDRAVSPVIGVILMVAIVVILAAVVGTFVLQFGDQSVESAPNVRFDAVYDERPNPNGQYLNVTVQGGERAPTESLEFVVNGATDQGGNPVSLVSPNPTDQAGSELITADTIRIDRTSFGLSGSDHVDLSDATVILVWDPDPESAGPGQTQSIWVWEDD